MRLNNKRIAWAGAAVFLAALVLAPATTSADRRGGYYDRGDRYSRGYHGGSRSGFDVSIGFGSGYRHSYSSIGIGYSRGYRGHSYGSFGYHRSHYGGGPIYRGERYHAPRVYYYDAPSYYYAPPVVYAPPPVVYYPPPRSYYYAPVRSYDYCGPSAYSSTSVRFYYGR